MVIRDELSPWLDPGSVKPGASSHSYKFEYYGDRDIKFTFDNILLPDSSTNLEASQGFVSFRVSQKPGVPLETDIENRAGIFFDFNAPVYTNTTVHRVGEDFVTVATWQPLVQGINLRVMPNPVAETAILQIDGLPDNADWQVALLDAAGQTVRTEQVSGLQWKFQRNDLPAGVYFLRVVSGQKVLGTGKVSLK
ncbi:MAG: T9SS type A sorting domain-containing protein [Lewinellaceae bacterium]|nr:T9SS type A sorting domain-containing protein [Lewinellaceae bacterium]